MRLLAALFVALLSPLLTGAAPGPWTFDRDASRIEMSVQAFGLSSTGRFEDWRGTLALDPASPESARASVTIEAASLKISPAIATGRAIGPGFLDAARHPLIRVDLISFEPEGGTRYNARANITAKGHTRAVAFPLDLRISGDRAHLTGALTLDRADFGIGTSGPWNTLVGRQVTVRVVLQASPD